MKFLLPPSRWISFPTSIPGSVKGSLLHWNVARQRCQPTDWPCLHTLLHWCSFSCCLRGGLGSSLCLLPAASSALVTVLPPTKSLSLTPSQTSRGQKRGKITKAFHNLTYSGFHGLFWDFHCYSMKNLQLFAWNHHTLFQLCRLFVCPTIH